MDDDDDDDDDDDGGGGGSSGGDSGSGSGDEGSGVGSGSLTGNGGAGQIGGGLDPVSLGQSDDLLDRSSVWDNSDLFNTATGDRNDELTTGYGLGIGSLQDETQVGNLIDNRSFNLGDVNYTLQPSDFDKALASETGNTPVPPAPNQGEGDTFEQTTVNITYPVPIQFTIDYERATFDTDISKETVYSIPVTDGVYVYASAETVQTDNLSSSLRIADPIGGNDNPGNQDISVFGVGVGLRIPLP